MVHQKIEANSSVFMLMAFGMLYSVDWICDVAEMDFEFHRFTGLFHWYLCSVTVLNNFHRFRFFVFFFGVSEEL